MTNKVKDEGWEKKYWTERFNEMYPDNDGPVLIDEDEIKNIKSFIKSLLQQQREEILKDVEEIANKILEHEDGDDLNPGCPAGWGDKCECSLGEFKSALQSLRKKEDR